MHRWTRFVHVLLTTAALTAPTLAQLATPQPAPPAPPAAPADAKSKTEQEKETTARHQAALTLLDLVLAGAKNLSLPQNRIALASDAFPILWTHNQSQARSLVTQMTGDFAQAASREQESPEPNARQMLHQQWQVVLQTIAQSDAELALSFMNATHTFAQIGNPEQEEAEERNLRLELAAQEAAHNPRNALRLAEKDLQTPGDLPQELLNLLTQITASDPEAGAQLLREIVARVRGAGLSPEDGSFIFALNLLNTQANSQPNSPANGAPPDDSLKTLAHSVASAALSPEFPATSLPMLQGSKQTFELYAPSLAQALSQKVEESIQAFNPQQEVWNQFNEAQASGDPNQLLAVAEQASPEVRSNMYQQVAWQFANNGDLQRARQAAEKLPDPFQREQVLQQALRQSASNAANQGEFAAARQLAQEITPDEERATLLAQFASSAAARQPALAQEMLEEAGGLLLNRAAGAPAFAAQLQVAQAFAHVKPARAVPLLERSAGQLEQVLAAAVAVDPFLPYPRSFDSGELKLNNSFLCNSLIRPYAEATAELANYDLPAARILADRLSLPEARLLAELLVARNALGDTPPPEPAGVVLSGSFLSRMRY
ncbi:MAG: hypothetical protein ACLPHP_14950 [Candidatus Sulfotelmatobacter sp.]